MNLDEGSDFRRDLKQLLLTIGMVLYANIEYRTVLQCCNVEIA